MRTLPPVCHASRMWLVSLFLLGACAGGSRQPMVPAEARDAALTPEEVVSAATRLVEQYRQGYEVRSVEAIEPLYLRAVDLVVVHQGRALLGWSALEQHLTEFFAGATEVHVRLTDVSVLALGTGGASVTATMTRSVAAGQTSVQEQGTLTLALRAEGDRWVIVGEHFSYVPTQR
jgi:hypothetical protein